MKTYIYKYFGDSISEARSQGKNLSREDFLNKIGSDGWEVISTALVFDNFEVLAKKEIKE